MRKHVAPAHPDARIPDMERGRPLPPGGIETEWTSYWASMEQRGDVIVTEIEPVEVEDPLVPRREPDAA